MYIDFYPFSLMWKPETGAVTDWKPSSETFSKKSNSILLLNNVPPDCLQSGPVIITLNADHIIEFVAFLFVLSLADLIW